MQSRLQALSLGGIDWTNLHRRGTLYGERQGGRSQFGKRSIRHDLDATGEGYTEVLPCPAGVKGGQREQEGKPTREDPKPTMRRSYCGKTLVATFLASGLLATCQFPTDRSEEVFVTIDSPSQVIVRGTTLTLTARVWRRGPDETRAEVRGATVHWLPGDERVATVQEASPGRALVTGVGEGAVAIRAIAVDYEEARPGEVMLRVASTVEIDSVRPLNARYGEQLTVFGVGLGQFVQVSLAGTPLILDSASFNGDPVAATSARFWLPYPAVSGIVSAVARQGTSISAPDSTLVLPFDVYDDSGDLPAEIDLNGPVLRQPDTLFFNPALALESGQVFDGYRFSRSDTTRPVSFIISTVVPTVFDFEPVLLPPPRIPQAFPEEDGGGPDWSLGVTGQHCHGDFVSFPRPFRTTASVTLVRAFRRLPAPEVLLSVYGEPVGRYGIAVVDGYVLADSTILPDRFEDNDVCVDADHNSADPQKHIDPGAPFTDTLTIDNPFEADWFRFTIPTSDTTLLTIRTSGRPFGATDSSDLGLVLRRVETHFFEEPIESHVPGSAENLVIEAFPGDYYLAVVDDAGVPTRYTLCIGRGSSCPLLDASGERTRYKRADAPTRATEKRIGAPPPFTSRSMR